jgi:hypothetical protein
MHSIVSLALATVLCIHTAPAFAAKPITAQAARPASAARYRTILRSSLRGLGTAAKVGAGFTLAAAGIGTVIVMGVAGGQAMQAVTHSQLIGDLATMGLASGQYYAMFKAMERPLTKLWAPLLRLAKS